VSSHPPALPGSYLVLETSGACNLACVHCDRTRVPPCPPSEQVHGGPFLDVGLALALVEDLGRFGARFDTLILFWLGDPLLHPHFATLYPSLLRANERFGVFGKIEVHTNAVALHATLVPVLPNDASTPQVWHLTLDAARSDTYRQIKGRDGLAEVERQVSALLEHKGRLGATWPRLVLQFIVSDRNAAEVGAFRDRWEPALRRAGQRVTLAAGHVPPGDGLDAVVFLRQLDCPTPEEQEQQNGVFRATASALGLALPSGARDAAPVVAHSPSPCSGFWKSPVIRWNGDITVCTRDSGLALCLGNIRDHSFTSLWWGAGAEARRARVAMGDYDGLPLCATCFIPRSANYTGIVPADIEAHARWMASARSSP